MSTYYMHIESLLNHCVRKSTYHVSYDSRIHMCIYIHACMHLCVICIIFIYTNTHIDTYTCMFTYIFRIGSFKVVMDLKYIQMYNFICMCIILMDENWTWIFVRIPCANDILCDSENRIRAGLLFGSPAWKVESYAVTIIFVSRPGCRQSLHVPNVWSLL